MDITPLLDALDELLTAHCPPATVRALEAGGDATALWAAIESSGFCDALRPEADGGAGLDWNAAAALLELCGRHALPVPLGQTLAARGLLAVLGLPVPAGAIVMAVSQAGAALELVEGAHADWLLLQDGVHLTLYDLRGIARQRIVHAPLDARIEVLPAPFALCETPSELAALQAAVLAAQMAGAMRRVLEMSVQHARQRTQFGRAIGTFQAVQQQLAVMAEQVEFAGMAARMAAQPGEPLPDPLQAALAKAGAGSVAASVAAAAHAVHGAIGITEDYDLQLWTRRLHAWRLAGGSESYWHARIGHALLAAQPASVPEFVLARLVPR